MENWIDGLDKVPELRNGKHAKWMNAKMHYLLWQIYTGRHTYFTSKNDEDNSRYYEDLASETLDDLKETINGEGFTMEELLKK